MVQPVTTIDTTASDYTLPPGTTHNYNNDKLQGTSWVEARIAARLRQRLNGWYGHGQDLAFLRTQNVSAHIHYMKLTKGACEKVIVPNLDDANEEFIDWRLKGPRSFTTKPFTGRNATDTAVNEQAQGEIVAEETQSNEADVAGQISTLITQVRSLLPMLPKDQPTDQITNAVFELYQTSITHSLQRSMTAEHRNLVDNMLKGTKRQRHHYEST